MNKRDRLLISYAISQIRREEREAERRAHVARVASDRDEIAEGRAAGLRHALELISVAVST